MLFPQRTRSPGCAVACGQYGRRRSPFLLDLPYRYCYICWKRITWCKWREAAWNMQQRAKCCVGEYYHSEEAPLTFCHSLRSSFYPSSNSFWLAENLREREKKTPQRFPYIFEFLQFTSKWWIYFCLSQCFAFNAVSAVQLQIYRAEFAKICVLCKIYCRTAKMCL